jgi:uncharacterized OB-fold protein
MGGKKEQDVRLKRFGTVSFTATTKVNDFIDHLEKGEVAGTRCKGCGQKFFPPRADCCKCLDSDVEWFPVEGAGKLLSYSRLQYAPVGFTEDVPYAIAVLDYGDYKVFGRISDAVPEDDIQIGMSMTARPNTLENGQLNYVFEKA